MLCVLATSWVQAIPVEPAIQRTLTDQSGRTTNALVVGVTAEALEIVRATDQSKFNIALERLSPADQAFGRSLLARLQSAQPLPDTPWLETIRRDFQMYDAAKRQFIPLPAATFAQDRILVVAFTGMYSDPATVFDSRMGYMTPSGQHVAMKARDEAPVLWIVKGGELSDFHIAAQKLPEGHAMISYVVRERVEKRTAPLMSEAISAWYKRNPVRPSQTSVRMELTAKERDALNTKLAAVVPIYWFEPTVGFLSGMESSLNMPLFGAFYRDGKVVKYRGEPVRGRRQEVMRMLRSHGAELE